MTFTGKILALDIATTTGWATAKPGARPTFGSLRFGPAGAKRPPVYRAFRLWLDEMEARERPALIVFESTIGVQIQSGRTTLETIKRLVGMCEHLEEWAHNRVELREANVSQVRQHFVGPTWGLKSDAIKAKVRARCIELGWKVGDDLDAADACALWDYQVCCLRPELAVSTTRLFGPKTVAR